MKPFIFIHIPKTAGISISRIIDKYGQRKLHIRSFNKPINENKGLNIGHISIFHLLKNDKIPREYFDISFKFCFVRNPWDRAVSLYEFLKRRGIIANKKFKNFLNDLKYNGMVPIGSSNVRYNSQCNPQVKWIINKGRCVVDYIGRFERLQGDFNRLCNQLDIPKCKLPRENIIRKKNYKLYYDGNTKKLAANIYEEDIDFFRYSF